MQKKAAGLAGRATLTASAGWLAAAWLTLGAGLARGAPIGSVYNPSDYTTGFGALNVGSGTTLTLYTGTSSANPYYSLDGGTTKIYGSKVSNASNKVQMAVFCFDSVNIDNPTAINITGQLGLVLGSRGDFTFANTTLNVAGSDGTVFDSYTSDLWSEAVTKGGTGGPGADGGVTVSDANALDAGNTGGNPESNPPGTYGGDGGFVNNKVMGNQARYGRGIGGGRGLNFKYAVLPCGGGGGYGGKGDDGNNSLIGGVIYGDTILTNLYGGSGGGGPAYGDNSAKGGGGGGSVELVAKNRLIVSSGTINAYGGAGGKTVGTRGGGGGSGGGVLLAGKTIAFSGTVSAYGGAGYDGTYGGGGGGRVAFYLGNIWSKTLADLQSVNGDADGNGLGGDFSDGTPAGLTLSGTVDVQGVGNNTGRHGSFYVVSPPPPPGTVVLFN